MDCEAGVIDADYRKPLSIMMFNFGDEDYIGIIFYIVLYEETNVVINIFLQVVEGERIAQIILGWIDTPPVVEVGESSAVMLKYA